MALHEPIGFRALAVTEGRLQSGTVPEFGFDPAWLAALERHRFALQIREKALPDQESWRLVRSVRAKFGGALLVNGRADLALAAGAEGVHLPAGGLPAAPVRAAFPGLLVGVSAHSVAEVEAARRAGADYVVFGPIFETPSKRSYGPPLGLDALAEAAAVGLPVFAIGGVNPQRSGAVRAAGAYGVAGIRAFATTDALDAWSHPTR